MQWNGWHWLVLGLILGLCIEFIEINSWKEAGALHSINSFSTPSNVIVQGIVSNLRMQRLSWVFDIENAGRITCYWRNPPEFNVFANGDFVRLRARIERTSTGLLCIVRELVRDAD